MCKISVTTFLFFILFHVWNVEAEWVKINQAPVCFEGRNNRPGQFMHIGEGMVVGALKLVWKNGEIRCVSDVAHSSKWGCYQYSTFRKYPFNVIVTDAKDDIIFPNQDLIKHTAGLWYYLPGQDEKTSEAIVFSNFEAPFYLHHFMQIKLWYGEDLKNWSEGDNQGRVCVDVFAWPMKESSGGSSSVGGGSSAANTKAIGILSDLKVAFDKVINKAWLARR